MMRNDLRRSAGPLFALVFFSFFSVSVLLEDPANQTASSPTQINATTEDESSLPLLPLVPPEQHHHQHETSGKAGLRFEEEPADSYIVRSKSAVLRCRTLNALNAWFTCNSGDERRIQSNQKISNYVDPQTGIRLIEIDLEITRSDVEEHTNRGYTNPFQCWCTAYGGHHQVMSRKASVSFAYLKKHFAVEPKSVTVALDSRDPVHFKCHPPLGVPTPIVFWMRNDVIILESEPAKRSGSVAPSHKPHRFTEHFVRSKKMHRGRRTAHEQDEEEDDEEEEEEEEDEDEEYDASHQPEKESNDVAEDESDLLLPHHFDLAGADIPAAIGPGAAINYHMTDDHTLVIKQVTANDQANYTCGVYNVAGVRFTRPAALTVFVNGEWSSWGSWSPCQLPPGLAAQGLKCGLGTQKRLRHCNNPAPVNNGQFCPGESVQVTECSILCPPIDGFWSAWSQWSTCSPDCTQIRRRVCNNPSPQHGGHECFGTDFMVKNCTGGLCRKLFDPTNFLGASGAQPTTASNDQIYFIIIFILILIILTFLVYIVLKFQLHRRGGRHGSKTSGMHQHATWFASTDSGSCCPGLEPEDPGGGTLTAGTNQLGPTLLLLQQQSDGRFYNKPVHTAPHPLNHYPLEPLGSPSRSLVDKYQLVSRRLNNGAIDHFLGPPTSSSPSHPPKVPLPTIPRDGLETGSYLSGSNRYEEPQFAATTKSSPALAAGTNSSSGSARTTTTTSVGGNEYEPDYAEPIMFESPGLPPPTAPAPPVPVLPPAIPCGGTPTRSISSEESAGSELSLGRHEKLIKLSAEICRYGHYSAMPNLGVALYLPPGCFETDTLDGYVRYGVDTRARYPGHCSLSSVATLSWYNEPASPVVLCFRHCLSTPVAAHSNSLVLLWQPTTNAADPHKSRWTELVRLGQPRQHDSYVHLEHGHVFLVTRLTGRFVFGYREPMAESPGHNGSLRRDTPLFKSVNFSLTIEQFNQEHLVKCFVYDDLPASAMMFQNELPPTTQLLRVMLGTSSYKLSLGPAESASNLCFEIQAPAKLVRGSARMEIPMEHLSDLGPNWLLHCSFVVTAASSVDDDDEGDLVPTLDSSESTEDESQVPTYMNDPPLVRLRRHLDYDVKVWQSLPPRRKPRTPQHSQPGEAISLTLNRHNLAQLRRLPGPGADHYCQEECCRLFGDAELDMRNRLAEQLGPSGWCQWASLLCPQDLHRPDGWQLMELWESITITELITENASKKRRRARRKHRGSPPTNPMRIKELFYAKLLHQLQSIQRADLIELILGHHQC